MNLNPKTDLGKMLLVIVQEIGSQAPMAFAKVNVENALKQVDELVLTHPRVAKIDGKENDA